MRGLTVFVASGVLVASLVTSSVAASPTGRANSFTGDFDIVAGTTTIGR
jgi:hypothetical protein